MVAININMPITIVITILVAVAATASDQPRFLPSLYFRGNHYQLGFEMVSTLPGKFIFKLP